MTQYPFRWLFRNPLFTIATILTLAMAIGSNTAIFSLLNAAFFPPLPYEDSDRLVEIREEKNLLVDSIVCINPLKIPKEFRTLIGLPFKSYEDSY